AILLDAESQKLWSRKGPGGGGFTIRIDARAVYHGHGDHVTSYSLGKGAQSWRQKVAMVLFGWQTAKFMYAGTGDDRIHCLDKKDGKKVAVYKCDDPVMSCATTPDGKYVFGGDGSSSVYCFGAKGERLWKLGTGCGSALSMQLHRDRLYLVTTSGHLACLDVSESAIKAAQAGTVPA